MAGIENEAPEPAPEPDIDAMDDKQFAEFKSGMDKSHAEQEPAKEEAKPDAAIADRADGEQADDDKNVVPHGQFHRERERRKEAERISELSQKRLAELLEAMQPRQPEPARAQEPEAPDPDKDIFGYVRHLESEIKAIKGEASLSREQQQAQTYYEQSLAASEADVVAFAKEQPAAIPATQFLVNQIVGELQAFSKLNGQPLTQQAVEQEIRNREYQVVEWARSICRRPAEVFYELALSRGFNPGAVPAQGQQQSQPDGVKAEIEKMVRTEETKRKALSLGGSGGPSGTQSFTPKDVVDMSEEDFLAFKAKHGENAMAKVFGLH